MNEKQWILTFSERLQDALRRLNENLVVETGKKIVYAQEILAYGPEIPTFHSMKYETDLLISENDSKNCWKPRVIIEGKLGSVTTHDAITYSQKAATHKSVHPYLRYGILLGNRKHYPLPGRLFRHGANFDFMISWKTSKASDDEWSGFIEIIEDEIESSKQLEEIIFNSRSRSRQPFTYLHRPLRLK